MGLAPILPVLLRLLVHDWYYVEFTAWACSHTSSTTLSTGSRLVLRRVYCMGLAPILSSTTLSTGSRLVLYRVYCMGLTPILLVLFRLLVHD
jgi:hypothetical protein